MEAVIFMRKKFRRSIENLPRHIYIYLKCLFQLAALMLAGSCFLFAFGGKDPVQQHLAVLLLENPAGVLLLGLIGLAILLDSSE